MVPATLAAVAFLGACASPSAPTPAAAQSSQSGAKIIAPEIYFAQPAEVFAAPGDVFGLGTVIQHGDSEPQFCLGPVRQSIPPQCSGPEIAGWDWATVDGHETSGTVTWGAYAMTGTWDGVRFTLKYAPAMLALFDPLPFVDPYLDSSNAGVTAEARLREIQTAMNDSTSFRPLASSIENGYLFVTFTYDDGRLQRYLDQAYGADVVIVRPALHDVQE